MTEPLDLDALEREAQEDGYLVADDSLALIERVRRTVAALRVAKGYVDGHGLLLRREVQRQIDAALAELEES